MKYYILLILISCLASLPAIVTNHIPPQGFEPAQQQEIRLEVLQNWSDLAEAIMYFRVQDSKFYEQVAMEKETPEGPWLKANLPVSTSPDKGYEYYFKFTMQNGSVETLPVAEAESRPFLVNPKSKTGEESADFILLTDEPIILAKDGYTLAVSWYALEDNLDPATISVFVNGKNVTKRVTLNANVLLYNDKDPRPGTTTAYVTAMTRDGRKLHSATWSTGIKATGNITALPMNLRGSINAGTSVYTSNKDANALAFGSDTDDGWANMELYSEYKKLALNAYTYVSTLESEKAQAINRYRFGFMLPTWETYLGDYSPDISKLTMTNRNLRGIYTNYSTHDFGLTLAHGEMLRAVKGTQTTFGGFTNYGPGTFKQEAVAARVRFGGEKGFSLAFNTTRNRDIISSLDDKFVNKYSLNEDNETDTTQMAFPIDNLVMSADARLNFPAQNTVVGIEFGTSLYNKNTLTGPLNKDDLGAYLGEETNIDPSAYQDIFIINTNMQPLPLTGSLKDPLPYSAWTTYYRSLWFNNLLNMSYSHVGASYKALSASYLQNDATQFSLTDQYNVKQLFFITSGYNRTRDNLASLQLETNVFQSYFAQVLVRVPKYPYLSVAYNGSQGKNEKNEKIDSVDVTLYHPYEKKSGQIAFGLGYEFYQIPIAPTTVDVGFKTGNDNEQTMTSTGRFEDLYDNNSNNISLNAISKFTILPLKTQVSISSNTQELRERLTPDKDRSNLNFMLKGEYRLFENRLLPWAEFRTTSLGGDQDAVSYNYITLGCQARPLEQTFVDTSLGWKFFGNEDQNDVDYSTLTWRLTINQRF